MVCSIIVAFTEAALEIASILGLDGGLGSVEWIHGGRRVIEHGGGGALREGLESEEDEEA
jgi:hypothetical protein